MSNDLLPPGDYDVTCIHIAARRNRKNEFETKDGLFLRAEFVVNHGDYTGNTLTTNMGISNAISVVELSASESIRAIADALGLDTLCIADLKDINVRVSVTVHPSTVKGAGMVNKIVAYKKPHLF